MSAFLFASFLTNPSNSTMCEKVRNIFANNGSVIRFTDELTNDILSKILIVNKIDTSTHLSFHTVGRSTGDTSEDYLEPEYKSSLGLDYLLPDFSNVMNNLSNVVRSLRQCASESLIFEGFLLTSYGYDDNFKYLETSLDLVVSEYITQFLLNECVPSLKILVCEQARGKDHD